MNEDTPITPAEAAAGGAALEPSAELEQLRREAEEWRDKYVRKLAEFENFRKRTRGELDAVRDVAVETVLLSLLPVLDDFDRMLADRNMPQDDPYRKGVELIRGKLWSAFAARGVTKLESLGQPFDPVEHEAMAVQPMAGFPAGTVLLVLAPGYRLGERVIRHAQVIVSGEVAPAGESGDGEEAAR
ncbi:nucleotide exchange factor GrpE [candidate division KSB1 bacterium]|nr:nucleotide exchange factor GrpE [candidate division KSB1 bacterium]